MIVGEFIASSLKDYSRQLVIPVTQDRVSSGATRIVIYGANNTNGANYDSAFSGSSTFGQKVLGRYFTVGVFAPGEYIGYGVSAVAGPSQPLKDATDMINSVLTLDKSGSKTRIVILDWTGSSDGTVKTGYYDPSFGSDGTSGPNFFAVNGHYKDQHLSTRNTDYIEGLEMSLVFNNIFGHGSTLTFLAAGQPTAVGNDYAKVGGLFAPGYYK
jgi:hypothetical protein